MADRPVQFGIIACSSVARRRFLPALKLARGAELASIGSRDPAKAAQFAHQFSAPRHGTYEDVLADPQINCVYISTPPTLHAEWALRAAAAGKHVLCEKPAFSSRAEALRVLDGCRAAGVKLLEGYAFRYHPQHAQAHSLVAEGKIGAPRYFTGEVMYPRPAEGDIRLNPHLAGGVFHDSTGYPVAAALMHMPGEPATIYCVQSKDRESGVDDACAITLQFSGGEVAQLYSAFGINYRSRYAISGVAGRIELQRAFAVAPEMQTTVTLETAHNTESFIYKSVDQFRLMIEDFADAISGGAAPGNRYERDLLRQQTVMDAAAQSLRERRTIEIKDL
jgi:NDP-hexose-3-ketoreductase